MKEIDLKKYSRDDTGKKLVQLEDGSYYLKTDLSYRMGQHSENGYFVDPSGGPFLYPGYKNSDFEIETIDEFGRIFIKEL